MKKRRCSFRYGKMSTQSGLDKITKDIEKAMCKAKQDYLEQRQKMKIALKVLDQVAKERDEAREMPCHKYIYYSYIV